MCAIQKINNLPFFPALFFYYKGLESLYHSNILMFYRDTSKKDFRDQIRDYFDPYFQFYSSHSCLVIGYSCILDCNIS